MKACEIVNDYELEIAEYVEGIAEPNPFHENGGDLQLWEDLDHDDQDLRPRAA